MSKIQIDTENVLSTGNQFLSKRADLEALVSQANSLMNSLQGQFTGQRASRIFNEWAEMQPNLQNAIQSLQAAGDLLKKASTDFFQADSTM
jgi:WXG100 family type VII secretion target